MIVVVVVFFKTKTRPNHFYLFPRMQPRRKLFYNATENVGFVIIVITITAAVSSAPAITSYLHYDFLLGGGKGATARFCFQSSTVLYGDNFITLIEAVSLAQ